MYNNHGVLQRPEFASKSLERIVIHVNGEFNKLPTTFPNQLFAVTEHTRLPPLVVVGEFPSFKSNIPVPPEIFTASAEDAAVPVYAIEFSAKLFTTIFIEVVPVVSTLSAGDDE